jgi:hypothetical protein
MEPEAVSTFETQSVLRDRISWFLRIFPRIWRITMSTLQCCISINVVWVCWGICGELPEENRLLTFRKGYFET